MIAMQPSLPEHQPSPSQQPARPILKTPSEIATLKQKHDGIKVREEKARAMVRAATPDHADRNSPEYQLVQGRIARGEPLDIIRKKSAVGVLGRKGEALDVEKEYQQAKADVYENEGVIPGRDEQLIRVLDRLDNNQPVRVEAPIVQYVKKRLQQGVTSAQLRAEAQGRMQNEQQTRNGLRILTEGREGKLDPTSADYQTYVVWTNQGWTTDAGFNQVQAAVQQWDIDQEKRIDYARAISRLSKIPAEREAVTKQHATLSRSISQDMLGQVRSEIVQISQARPEVNRQQLKQRVVQVMDAPKARGESRRYGITNGASDELYCWQADTFGNPTQTNNDLIYKGYLQVDIEDIPEAVEMLREAVAERFNSQGKPLEFKWLVSKFTGSKPQIGEYAPMKDREPRIALYGDNPWDIPEVFAKITQDPRWAERFRNISEKRNSRARRPGTSAWIDSNTGYEWRALNFNEQPGLSESFSANQNWRQLKRGTHTRDLSS